MSQVEGQRRSPLDASTATARTQNRSMLNQLMDRTDQARNGTTRASPESTGYCRGCGGCERPSRRRRGGRHAPALLGAPTPLARKAHWANRPCHRIEWRASRFNTAVSAVMDARERCYRAREEYRHPRRRAQLRFAIDHPPRR